MPSTEAPNWWADVQQEREDLTGGRSRRPVEDWLGEDIDFVPRRRMARSGEGVPATDIRPVADDRDDTPRTTGSRNTTTPDGAPGTPRTTGSRNTTTPDGAPGARRTTRAVDTTRLDGADHPLHGVFVRAASQAPARVATSSSRTIELTTDGPAATTTPASAPTEVAHELAHLSAADDPFASPPPPPGTRRTVQIKGRPGEFRVPSLARRHRPRTASDRVGPRPDRIALWVVALGAILIILAATTSSSQAAMRHRAPTASAISAKAVHAAVHAPLRSTHRHR
jgi:hypothetical protein